VLINAKNCSPYFLYLTAPTPLICKNFASLSGNRLLELEIIQVAGEYGSLKLTDKAKPILQSVASVDMRATHFKLHASFQLGVEFKHFIGNLRLNLD
jgi:hypothetical protein